MKSLLLQPTVGKGVRKYTFGTGVILHYNTTLNPSDDLLRSARRLSARACVFTLR